jgi:hypothetical protein
VLTLETRSLRAAGVGALALAASVQLLPVHDTVTCPLRATTGIPCPFCGTTRGVGRVLHGDVVGALALNPLSVLLVGAVVAVLVVVRRPTVHVPTWLPVVSVGALWAYQLLKYATGRPL